MACPFLRRTNLSGLCGKCANGGRPELAGNLCLDGYARGQCPAFPQSGDAPDAIEVTAGREIDGAVVVRYTIERDYLPVAIGEHTFEWASRTWRSPIADEMIGAHLEAYILDFEILKTGVHV